ncbi:hypothetical protein Tco_0714935 [Tanacetum coccineum]
MSHPPLLHSSTAYLHPWSDIEIDSCPSTATTISSTSSMNKLTFEGIRDMILSEDIHRRSSRKYLNSLLSAMGHGKKSNKDPRRNQYHTLGISQEYCESCVMDSGASFHATICMGMMKNFQPLLGKVRLTDMKVLDIVGIRDVVLKNTFGTEWIMKNVRYISSLKRKLISIGQLDNEGYHIGFGDQMWRVTRGSQIYAPRAELQENSISEPLRLDLVSHGALSNIFKNLGTCKGSGTKLSVEASGSLGASGSSVNRLSLFVCIDMVTSRKTMVKRWMFKDVKAFLHVNFDEYICVALSEGILIAGKEDLTCVETLYEWVVGFDEVLVAESNMTKINKLKRWFSLEKNFLMSELSEASTCLLKN